MTPGRYRYFVATALAMVLVLWLGRASFFSGQAPGIEMHLVDMNDENWVHGVNRRDPRIILLTAAEFPDSRVARGDFIQFGKGAFREVADVKSIDIWLHVTLREPLAGLPDSPVVARLVREI